MTTSNVSDTDIHALRAFNRFYTRKAGVLGPYLSSDLSLTDVRVLYEVAHGGGGIVATDIARKLGHDNGYLSRILKRFENKGWLLRTPNPRDGRQSLLDLTGAGRAAFAPLEARSHAEAGAVLGALADGQRRELMDAMETIQRLLGDVPASSFTSKANDVTPGDSGAATPVKSLEMDRDAKDGMDVDGQEQGGKKERQVVIRGIRPGGDLGWVVQTHGEVYHREYGWTIDFEALAAEIVGEFGQNCDPNERAWIAEVDGERVGCVFVVRGRDAETAKLRLLCLTPAARGLGVGSRLVDTVLDFSRERGFKRVELWTHSCLTTARAMYARRGFQMLRSESYTNENGLEMVGEFWELEL